MIQKNPQKADFNVFYLKDPLIIQHHRHSCKFSVFKSCNGVTNRFFQQSKF